MNKAWRKWLSKLLEQEIPEDALGVLVKHTGEVEFRAPANGKNYGLKEMQELVGGYIQVVPLPKGYVVCDEEGLYNQADKPNAKATEICTGHVLMAPSMMGDVLFCVSRAIK